MFRRVSEQASASVRIEIEGTPVLARAGDTVTAALLASGLDFCRETAVSGARTTPVK